MRCVSLPVALVVSGCLLAGCGGPSTPPASRDPVPAPATAAPAPAATPSPATVSSVGDLFPPGLGREQVLNTCGSCHPVACTARGQRTAAQWDRIQETHKDMVAGVSDTDRAALYSYLKATFNDTRPEPVIPAEFLQQGCTPF